MTLSTICWKSFLFLAIGASTLQNMAAQSCPSTCAMVCDNSDGECDPTALGAVDWCKYPTTGCPAGEKNGGQCCCDAHTPIVIDVDGSGFSLTSLKNGVYFDLADAHFKYKISWTAQGSSNAFLVLDRNGNGVIDNGTELFGDVTPQPTPIKPLSKNGFLALAQYDQASYGGNEDGVINEKDSIYSRLRLWQDLNHDGISSPEELKTLPELGVAGIELHYEKERQTDSYGNIFRYRARILKEDGSHDGRWGYDVLLVTNRADVESKQAKESKK